MKFHVNIPSYFEITTFLFWAPPSNKRSTFSVQKSAALVGGNTVCVVIRGNTVCVHIKDISSMPLNHTEYMCVCVNKLVFKVILGNACVGGENSVPIVLPDICLLILKIVFKNKSGYFNNIFSWNDLRVPFFFNLSKRII